MPTLAVLAARAAGSANMSNAVVVWTGPSGLNRQPTQMTTPTLKFLKLKRRGVIDHDRLMSEPIPRKCGVACGGRSARSAELPLGSR